MRLYRTRLAVCGIAAAAAAACSSSPRDPPPPAFTDRTPLSSCGNTKASGPGTSHQDLYPADAMDCLARGRASTGAEWSLTVVTTEGDPITTYYRTEPTSLQVDIFIDSSRDEHSRRKSWDQLSCNVPSITSISLRACTSNR